MKRKMDSKALIAEADDQLTKLFRKQRKMRLYSRSGIVLFVDDKPEQMGFLERLASDTTFVNVQDLESAQEYVATHGPDAIKVVVVDIGLNGASGNRDGLKFVEWLRRNYNTIPFIVSTGRRDCVDDIKRSVPGTDVFVKGADNLVEYLDALGIALPRIAVEEDDVLPTDSHVHRAIADD